MTVARYDREGKEGVDKQKTVQMDPRQSFWELQGLQVLGASGTAWRNYLNARAVKKEHLEAGRTQSEYFPVQVA